jgi:formylglycine-generating enzyme required for sulfatase activity
MSYLRHLLSFAVWACLAVTVSSQAQPKESRVALVIGNAAYGQGSLANPVNDARAMATRLRMLGFDVILRENLKTRDIGGVYREFRSKISPGNVALVFYAGHGIQFKGQNYFPAVDSVINSEEDVPLQSLNLSSLLDNMEEAKAGVSLVFLDACRNNPYSRSFRSPSNGLAKVEAASGTLIHYATKPGSVAADGDGKNGTYTEALLAQMSEPGVPVELMLKRVANRVVAKTKGKQEPWVEGSLRGDFYFFGPTTVQVAPSVPVAPEMTASQREDAFWNDAKAAGNREAFQAYLDSYPKGRYASLAKANVARLSEASAASPARPVVTAVRPESFTASVSPPVTTSSFGPIIQSQIIKDCPECPELVIVPAGRLARGGNAAKQAQINPGRVSANVGSFAAARHAVSRGEFANFVGANAYKTEAEIGDGCVVWTGTEWKKDKSYNWRNVGFSQGDDHPVVCVSWNDAKAYAQWLSHISGKDYRLPSEAEREYAARAGTETTFWWGDSISIAQANYNFAGTSYGGGEKVAYRQATVSVSSFSPNPFGLYNVHGNVWEWVEDCFHENYSGAPSDGSAWTTGCTINARVLRGGSWFSHPSYLPSDDRTRSTREFRSSLNGFRLARTL